jgi:multidrug efflux pump subunit AcrA (membrane-fusion protein)
VALAVPRSAVLIVAGGAVVFVEKHDAHGRPLHGPGGELVFTRRAVVLDEEEAGDYVAVRSGLERGEQVVVRGAIELLGYI